MIRKDSATPKEQEHFKSLTDSDLSYANANTVEHNKDTFGDYELEDIEVWLDESQAVKEL